MSQLTLKGFHCWLEATKGHIAFATNITRTRKVPAQNLKKLISLKRKTIPTKQEEFPNCNSRGCSAISDSQGTLAINPRDFNLYMQSIAFYPDLQRSGVSHKRADNLNLITTIEIIFKWHPLLWNAYENPSSDSMATNQWNWI